MKILDRDKLGELY